MRHEIMARGSAKPALVNHAALRRRGPSGFDPARLERCEYCQCNRHLCGCDARFEYEQIRDNPSLFAR